MARKTLDVVYGIIVGNSPSWDHTRCNESDAAYPEKGGNSASASCSTPLKSGP